jgi:hypothetical protein
MPFSREEISNFAMGDPELSNFASHDSESYPLRNFFTPYLRRLASRGADGDWKS